MVRIIFYGWCIVACILGIHWLRKARHKPLNQQTEFRNLAKKLKNKQLEKMARKGRS